MTMKGTHNSLSKSSAARLVARIAREPRVLMGLTAVIAITAFAGGFHFRSFDPANQRLVEQLQQEVTDQYSEISELQIEHQQQVDALAARLAELHANATRLNALGQRLIQTGQLDANEFRFSDPVAIGGPFQQALQAGSARDIRLGLSQLENRLEQQALQLEALDALLMDRELVRTTTPSGWPIDQGWISSGFGRRTDPFTGQPANHAGMDFAGTRGSDVNAVGAGIVVWAGLKAGYGQTVDIDHGNGYVTRYAHNEAILVEPGQRVSPGQAIAELGDTGRASAPHVHFEVRKDGRPVNPYSFIR